MSRDHRELLDALYQLHRETGLWPTSAAIAARLGPRENEINHQLLLMESQHFVRIAVSDGERRWVPYEDF